MSEPISLPAPRLSIREILHPQAVAVFGASDDREKFGGRIIHFLTEHGFGGRIIPINPRRAEVRGHRAYARLADVPDIVDVAILAVPAHQLLAAITECAGAGVGCCVIIATGFAEADADGAALQRRMVETARAAGMRLIGPNCMGLINPHHKLALCSSVVLDVARLVPGRVGLISQSGALMVSLFDRGFGEGIAFSTCVSLGNQSDVEICDVLEYLIDDPQTDAIALYAEGFLNPARFIALAGRACDAGKPLVVLKTGKTAAGVRAAQSHTASLAGSYEAFAAACAAQGAVVVEDSLTLIRTANALARLPPIRGQGIGVISGSGGAIGVLADRIGSSGMRLARLSEPTREALRGILLPPQADNPIDLGGRLPDRPDDIAEEALRVLASDDDVAVLLLCLTSMPSFEARTRTLAEAALLSGKAALALVLPGPAADVPRQVLRDLGLPYFDSEEDLLLTLRAVLAYHQLAGSREVPPTRLPGLPKQLPVFCADGNGLADLMAAYGIAVPAARLCATESDAVSATAVIGYPVVLKAVVRGATHKSDLGLVQLGIADATALQSAWRRLAEVVAAHDLTAAFEGCLVQQHLPPGLELIAAIRRDPQFGPFILAGFGGILVELFRDVASAPAPLSPVAARRLLESLRAASLFGAVRGRPPRDIDAAAEALARLSWLAVDIGSRLTDLEINPLIVAGEGGGVCAVDIRATLTDGDI